MYFNSDKSGLMIVVCFCFCVVGFSVSFMKVLVPIVILNAHVDDLTQMNTFVATLIVSSDDP
jgi:hypothetical protein